MRNFLRRAAIILIVFPVFALLLLTGDNRIVPPPRPPENVPHAVVALGDSTMSGEGAGNYTPDTDGPGGDWCHRAPQAMVQRIKLPDVTKIFNFACSGANSQAIRLDDASSPSSPARPPSSARSPAPTASTPSSWPSAPTTTRSSAPCSPAASTPSSPPPNPAAARRSTPTWQNRVNAMVPKVVAALRDIRRVMVEPGYADSAYQLALQSYAAPVAPDILRSLQNVSGCPLRTDDLHWVQDRAVPVLNDGIRRAADQGGARFLDLSRAGVGHEACTGGQEWFTRLTLNLGDIQDKTRYTHALQQSFHPNAAGYTAFARCMSQFLTLTVRHAACVPDGHGDVQLALPTT